MERMLPLHLSPIASEKAGSAIVISGSGRSGTTIIGKLLHSFEGVEYAFEPPMLVSLLPLIESMDAASWRLLYETYVYEEFFINAMTGRAINTNRADDSSIYQVKSAEEIDSRLQRSIRKLEAERLTTAATVAYKLPNVIPFLPRLAEYYPHTRFLIMKRDAVGTINSLIEKGWFSDESVRTSMVWPFRLLDGVKIPSWVKEGDDRSWVEMPEIDRCAYYYIRVSEGVEHIPNRIELSYRDLLSDPHATACRLAKVFGLQPGSKTDAIVSSIRPADKVRDMDITHRIDPRLAQVVAYYSGNL